ncbi:hypothetical protein ALT761_01976 [Alteromonas sp. 76-1]|uniref:hypothetical protein n=1 Tax=Alteromonas sp. 76-1 TaxID=2358187 RepID=UPI000FD15DBF|nr:hypothetical protein [Alteromonas sp. 76-1]VEL96977.1 hypothetical protein ALT761_01976 [Alteromonas sp. 76-1]
MTLKEWFKKHKSLEKRMELARAANSTVGYLNQLAYTSKKASVSMCAGLYSASAEITPEDVIFPEDERPDIAEVFSTKQMHESAA